MASKRLGLLSRNRLGLSYRYGKKKISDWPWKVSKYKRMFQINMEKIGNQRVLFRMADDSCSKF